MPGGCVRFLFYKNKLLIKRDKYIKYVKSTSTQDEYYRSRKRTFYLLSSRRSRNVTRRDASSPAPLHVLVPWPTFTPTSLSPCLRWSIAPSHRSPTNSAWQPNRPINIFEIAPRPGLPSVGALHFRSAVVLYLSSRRVTKRITSDLLRFSLETFSFSRQIACE